MDQTQLPTNEEFLQLPPKKRFNKKLFFVSIIIIIIAVATFSVLYFYYTQSTIPPKNIITQGSLKIVAPAIGIYLGAYNFGNGIKAFEDALGKKIAISGSSPCSSSEATNSAGDVACTQKAQKDTGYVVGLNFQCGNALTYMQEIIDGKLDSCFVAAAQNIKLLDQPMFWYYPREPIGQIRGGFGLDGTQGWTAIDKYSYFGCQDSTKEECLDGPERYIAAQRKIHDIVEGICKDCVTWVASASAYMYELTTDSSAKEYRMFYPGNAYVDWHAVNYYPYTLNKTVTSEGRTLNRQLFSDQNDMFNQWLDEAMRLDPTKPIIIEEFGPTDWDNKSTDANGLKNSVDWFEDFFKTVKLPRYKNVKAFLYWQPPRGYVGGISTYSRIEPGSVIGNLWKAEIQANPNFWVSDAITAGGQIITGPGGGFISNNPSSPAWGETGGGGGENLGVISNAETGSPCVKECLNASPGRVDYCNNACK